MNGGRREMATVIENCSKLELRAVIKFLHAKGNENAQRTFFQFWVKISMMPTFINAFIIGALNLESNSALKKLSFEPWSFPTFLGNPSETISIFFTI